MNILLITNGQNSDKNSSWLVYSKFVKFLRYQVKANIQVICFNPVIHLKGNDINETVIHTFLQAKILTAFFNRITRLYTWYIARLYSSFYNKKLVDFILKNDIKKLWVHTDLLSLLLLKNVLKKISIPFHLTVFDDPFTNRAYKPFKDKVEKLLIELFFKASSIDTPTIILAQSYLERGYLNTECQISESLVGTFKKTRSIPKIKEKIIRIGLVGSIYGMDALSVFLEALGDLFEKEHVEFHLRTSVPRIYLKYIEKNFPSIAKYTIVKPFIPEHELPLKLQDYDLLYLPMMFHEDYRFKTDTSFPSKTHNYLASGIPIIVHAPETSSVYQFFNKNKIGCLINSLDSQVIKLVYARLSEQKFRESLSSNIQQFNIDMQGNEHVISLYKVVSS